MNFPNRCPFCGNSSFVEGRHIDGEGFQSCGFEPANLHLSPLTKFIGGKTCVPYRESVKACLRCGKVVGELDPTALQDVILKYGNEELKGWLGSEPKA